MPRYNVFFHVFREHFRSFDAKRSFKPEMAVLSTVTCACLRGDSCCYWALKSSYERRLLFGQMERSYWSVPRFAENIIIRLWNEVGTPRERDRHLMWSIWLLKARGRWNTRTDPKHYWTGERGRNTPSIALCTKESPRLICSPKGRRCHIFGKRADGKIEHCLLHGRYHQITSNLVSHHQIPTCCFCLAMSVNSYSTIPY